jgi:hypothetical protein
MTAARYRANGRMAASRSRHQAGSASAGAVAQARASSVVTVGAPGLLGEADEPGQQLPGPLQLEAQAAAQGQVVLQRVVQPAHGLPPGHGRASAASAA